MVLPSSLRARTSASHVPSVGSAPADGTAGCGGPYGKPPTAPPPTPAGNCDWSDATAASSLVMRDLRSSRSTWSCADPNMPIGSPSRLLDPARIADHTLVVGP